MGLPVRKKDKVVVLSGRDRGKRGEVIRVISGKEKVLVAKINLVKKHKRPTREKPGGIITQEAPLFISQVQLVCPKCDQASRPRWQFLADGTKVRLCRKCGEQIL